MCRLCFNMEGIIRTEHYEVHIKICSTKEKIVSRYRPVSGKGFK